jgi:hypothetical protein
MTGRHKSESTAIAVGTAYGDEPSARRLRPACVCNQPIQTNRTHFVTRSERSSKSAHGPDRRLRTDRGLRPDRRRSDDGARRAGRLDRLVAVAADGLADRLRPAPRRRTRRRVRARAGGRVRGRARVRRRQQRVGDDVSNCGRRCARHRRDSARPRRAAAVVRAHSPRRRGVRLGTHALAPDAAVQSRRRERAAERRAPRRRRAARRGGGHRRVAPLRRRHGDDQRRGDPRDVRDLTRLLGSAPRALHARGAGAVPTS